jgi:hypothetical protein
VGANACVKDDIAYRARHATSERDPRRQPCVAGSQTGA